MTGNILTDPPPERRYETVTLLNGRTVRLRSMLRSEQRRWKTLSREREEYSDDVLLALSIVDDAGDLQVTTQAALEGCFDLFDPVDCQRMLAAAYRLSFVGPAKPLQAAIEDAVKNSPTPGSGSSTGSPGSNAARLAS